MRALLRVPDANWRGLASNEDRARAMADAVARETRASWAIAIGETETDAQGERAVPVAVRFPQGQTDCLRLGFRGVGETSRTALVTQLLDLVRRKLR